MDEICGQMYKTITLYAICGVEIYEWRDFYVAHGFCLSTEHTDTHGFFPQSEVFKRILVKDFIWELVAYGKMFWSSEDRVRARFHYAESRQNRP